MTSLPIAKAQRAGDASLPGRTIVIARRVARLLLVLLLAAALVACGDPVVGSPVYDAQRGWSCPPGAYQTPDDAGRPVCAQRR